MGDWLIATGEIAINQRGTPTITPETLTRLAQGIVTQCPQDAGYRRRHRFHEMLDNPQAVDAIRDRAELLTQIRSRLNQSGFLEVQTPILQQQYGGASAEPFLTERNGDSLYLRISPEMHLIMLMAGGLTQVYELGQCFRNEGADRTHNPEFTMLEFYQVNMTLAELQMMTQSLVQLAIAETVFNTITMQESVHQATGIYFTGDRLLRAFERYVQPTLQTPTFVTQFPAASSPLAQPNPQDSRWAEQFELYINGIEIANGYLSQTDPTALNDLNLDPRYIQALQTGMPAIAGAGIGIDRLLMLMSQIDIRDAIPFPYG